MLPPIPDWDGLHPLIIHFPIGLLLVAPILILVGLAVYKHSFHYFVCAWILMVLGTVSTYVAVATGEAAAELVERTAEIEKILEEHEELAELTRTLFTILTLLYGGLLFVPRVIPQDLKRGIIIAVQVVFLLLYSGGMVVLINTGHHGGILVHEYGVRAMLLPSEPDSNL